MKTGKMIQIGILPLTVVLFSMIFIVKPNLHGQDGKGKKGQPDVKIDVRREYDENGNVSRYDSSYSFSWSNDGSVEMDSLFESLRDNFGISPFTGDDFFSVPFGDNHFHAFPHHGQIHPEMDSNSIYEYIDPDDSIYSFSEPYDFFDNPHFGNPFNDSLYFEFFNHPLYRHDPWHWPDFDFFRSSPSDSASIYTNPFDMRSMMEKHRQMMEEMHQLFKDHLPDYPLTPDSIPQNPMQQRYHAPSRPLPKGQEI